MLSLALARQEPISYTCCPASPITDILNPVPPSFWEEQELPRAQSDVVGLLCDVSNCSLAWRIWTQANSFDLALVELSSLQLEFYRRGVAQMPFVPCPLQARRHRRREDEEVLRCCRWTATRQAEEVDVGVVVEGRRLGGVSGQWPPGNTQLGH